MEQIETQFDVGGGAGKLKSDLQISQDISEKREEWWWKQLKMLLCPKLLLPFPPGYVIQHGACDIHRMLPSACVHTNTQKNKSNLCYSQ